LTKLSGLSRLAIHYPELLTHQEQEVWKMLQDSLLLQPAQRRRDGRVSWDLGALEDKVFPMIRKHWSGLMSAYAGSPSSRADGFSSSEWRWWMEGSTTSPPG
jgi:hypothetical protein